MNDSRTVIEETKALIAEVEAGDTDHAAWVAIQDRIKYLHDALSTKAAVARKIGKTEDWVSGVLAWDSTSARGSTPWSSSEPEGQKARVRSNRAAARKMLRDPEHRAEVIEALTTEERLAVAEAALESQEKKGRERKQRERAVREERQPDPSSTHYERVRLDLAKADAAIEKAIEVAEDTAWPDEKEERLLRRIAITEDRLELLKLAVQNTGGIDWDDELRRLTEREEESA